MYAHQYIEHLVLLLERLHQHQLLGDVLIRIEPAGVADLQHDGVPHEVGGELADLLRPGGGEHDGLPLGRGVGGDLADLRLEAHIQPVERKKRVRIMMTSTD